MAFGREIFFDISDSEVFQICSVHLDRVGSIKVNTDGVDISWGNALNLLTREMLEETVRSRSVGELLAWMGFEGQGSVIIGGDFNTVLFSKAIRMAVGCGIFAFYQNLQASLLPKIQGIRSLTIRYKFAKPFPYLPLKGWIHAGLYCRANRVNPQTLENLLWSKESSIS